MIILRKNKDFLSKIRLNYLYGPYRYEKDVISAVIPENVKGNYILGDLNEDGDFIVKYVGRSDSNLKTRIGHDIGKYKHFYYSIADTAREAYDQECLMWHLYGGEEGNLDNSIHPDKPTDDHSAECFLCRLKDLAKY